MGTISIPISLIIPIMIWFVTYEATKHHGFKGWVKAWTDFYM